MDPPGVNSNELTRAVEEQCNLVHVKVGVFNKRGILRGKYMGRDKFLRC